jgi:spoIIIJ-associated protein
MEWVEAVGRTVDEAVAEAMGALGAASKEEVEIDVVDEGKKGFLGIGGQEARVRVTMKPKKRQRRRGRGRSKNRKEAKNGGKDQDQRKPQQQQPESDGRKRKKGGSSKDRQGQPDRVASGGADTKKVAVDKKPEEKADIEEQAQVAREFAEGLLSAFGIDGKVDTRVEDDILYLDISGDQTEALVGRKGAVVQAVHELTRTVIQRKTFGAPRMRLDIAGYAARRREALKIYAARLAESVKEDGREAMLEPMNAADRKVVHDAIAEIDGVRSYSEGEEPNRSVIVAPTD